jgi:ribose/xylose/arabinose/galactoside ABC-type transport system permease subunit
MANNPKSANLTLIGKRFSNLPLTVVLGAAMLMFFSLMTNKFMTVSNMMNVIVQVSSGVGIIAIASFLAICSTGVDLSLGGTIAVAGMMAGKIIVWETPFLNNIRAASPVLLVLIAIAAASVVGLFCQKQEFRHSLSHLPPSKSAKQ